MPHIANSSGVNPQHARSMIGFARHSVYRGHAARGRHDRLLEKLHGMKGGTMRRARRPARHVTARQTGFRNGYRVHQILSLASADHVVRTPCTDAMRRVYGGIWAHGPQGVLNEILGGRCCQIVTRTGVFSGFVSTAIDPSCRTKGKQKPRRKRRGHYQSSYRSEVEIERRAKSKRPVIADRVRIGCAHAASANCRVAV